MGLDVEVIKQTVGELEALAKLRYRILVWRFTFDRDLSVFIFNARQIETWNGVKACFDLLQDRARTLLRLTKFLNGIDARLNFFRLLLQLHLLFLNHQHLLVNAFLIVEFFLRRRARHVGTHVVITHRQHYQPKHRQREQ